MNISVSMSPSSPNSASITEGSSRTLAEMLFRLDDPRLRQELEMFRIKYEAQFGATDLTRRYTSTFSRVEQDWLVEHYPERYWKGLPPFAQAYLKEKMKSAHRAGKLDDMPPTFRELYLSGEMVIETDGHTR